MEPHGLTDNGMVWFQNRETGGGYVGMRRNRPASLGSPALVAVLLLVCTTLLAACSNDPTEVAEIPEPPDSGRSILETPNTCPVCEPASSTSGKGTGNETGSSGVSENNTEPRVTVVCGKNVVAALVLKSPSEVPLSDLLDRLEYLEVDPNAEKEHIHPFEVRENGIAQYGHYRLFDAETLEELDFPRPFGLPPQTHILTPTESGRSYIVELCRGQWSDDGETIVGEKFVFGIRIP